MVERARRKHPQLRFVAGRRARPLAARRQFDVIILSDLVNDAWDVQALLSGLAAPLPQRTRASSSTSTAGCGSCRSRRRAGSAWPRPVLKQNWLTVDDVTNLLHLSDFRAIRTWQEVLLPLPLPVLAPLCNRVLVRLWRIRHLALSNFILARPTAGGASRRASRRVSVVVPARNEAGQHPGDLRAHARDGRRAPS